MPVLLVLAAIFFQHAETLLLMVVSIISVFNKSLQSSLSMSETVIVGVEETLPSALSVGVCLWEQGGGGQALPPPSPSVFLSPPPHCCLFLLTLVSSSSLLSLPPHCSLLLLTAVSSSSLLSPHPHCCLLLLTAVSSSSSSHHKRLLANWLIKA